MRRSLDKYEVIIFSIIIGLSAYIIDAEVDAFIFHDGPFLDVLIFAVPLGEIYIRSYIFASFVIFGIFISRILAKRKKAEEALRESKERYRELTESISDVFFAMDKDFRYTYWNKASEKLTGISAKDAIGKSLTEVFPDAKGTKIEQVYLETLRTQQPQSYLNKYQLRGKDYVFEINAYPTKTGLSVFVKDITERKAIEETLQESEERYRMLFNSGNDAVFVHREMPEGMPGKFVEVNDATRQMLGYTREELLRLSPLNIVAPEDLDAFPKQKEKFHAEKRILFEMALVTKDGRKIPVEVTGHLFDLKGQPTVLTIARDITERKKAEEVLQESEERFRSVVENSHDGILIVDDNFRLIYANDELCRIFGYSREEIVGQDFRKFLGEDSVSLCQDMYLRRQRGEKVPSLYELRMVRKDGEKRDVEIKSTIIRDSQGKVQSVVQILDVTTQKRMEEERKRYEERLSALNFYGGKINTASNLQQVHELTLDAMEKTLGFEDATFMIIERGNLKVVCQRGYPKPILLELPLDGTKKGITVRAVNKRKPILVPDVKKDKDYVAGVPGIQSELAVPVVAEDKVLGVLDIESRKLGAFDDKDVTLLQILASHAVTAISNLERRKEIEKRSSQLASLMKRSAEMIHSTDLRQCLQTTAKAIRELGWRRVITSARDENLDIASPEDIVTAGLTEDERKFLWSNRKTGQKWRERFGPECERFKIGGFYHLPWSDPLVREKFGKGTIPSKLMPEEMVDWNPQDLLYASLRLADGRIVGVVSIDDPLDGKRPTRESLASLELFLHQAAVAIENAKLIQQLNVAREQIREYVDQLELKVKQRTQELTEAQNRLLKSERLAAIGEIAAMVGHDLRNPLTGIAGATYYLKMKSGPKMGKKTKEMLELIEGDI